MSHNIYLPEEKSNPHQISHKSESITVRRSLESSA